MKYFFTILFIVFCCNLGAHPINPATLPFLFFESEFIVIAKIENPQKYNGRTIKYDSICLNHIYESGDDDGIATLHIIEVLKGEIKNKVIKVEVPNFVCPTPPEYKDGKYVIAFLNKRHESDSIFETTSLAWGAKEDNDIEEKINEYKLSVLQLLRITKAPSHYYTKAYIEFLVQLCESELLKWDGIYSMIYQKENPYNYYDYKPYLFVEKNISQNQIERLNNVFFKNEILSESDLYFLNFITNKNRKQAASKILFTLSIMNVNDYDVVKMMDGFNYLYPNKITYDLDDDFSFYSCDFEKEKDIKYFIKSANKVLSQSK